MNDRHLEATGGLYPDLPQAPVGVAYFEDTWVAALVVLWRGTSVKAAVQCVHVESHHAAVAGVEDLLYQGEVLPAHPPLYLQQVGVHPGLVLHTPDIRHHIITTFSFLMKIAN